MKITIISLDNWGYNEYIVDELKTFKQVDVNHINFDKLRYKYPSILHKIFNFFLKNIFSISLKRKHLNKIILSKVKNLGYQNKILVIKAEFLSVKTLKELKENTSELIAFYNDNIQRCPRIKKVYPYFDVNYSFEKKDALKYNFNFITNYIYHKNLQKKPDLNANIKFDLFNISSLGKRNIILERVALALDKIYANYKIILVGKKKYTPKGGIIYQSEKIDIEEVNNYMSKSRTLLDVQRMGQSGLTFRVMDSLAFQKKLITTNPDIINYDFYNPNNILVIDTKNVEIPMTFFETNYESIPQNIYNKYTISSWVKTVFQLV